MRISKQSRYAFAAAALAVGASAPAFAQYSATVLSDNPLAYFPLNEAAGSTTATDAAGGDNTATQDGGTVTFGTAGLIAGGGTSAAFDATNNGRLVTAGFEKIGTGYTVEYWINVSAYPNNCCSPLVGDGEGAGDFYNMNYLIGPGQGTTGTVRPHYSPGNTPVANDSTGVLALNTTYHVVTTYDQNTDTASIYINGVLDETIAVTGDNQDPNFTANALFIGRDNREGYNAGAFRLDEVAVYDYALSGERVAAHYQAGIVPEPATLSLLGLGGLALLGRRRGR